MILSVMTSCTLFVRNKTDEFIGQVAISRQGMPDKLIVVDYTRDNNVFRNSSSSNVFSFKCDHPKFIGFTKYLNERKKAAVIKFQTASGEKDILFILPPANPAVLTEVSCLLSSDISKASSSQVPAATADARVATEAPRQQQRAAAPPAAPADAAAANKPVEGSSFLANLLNKASEGSESCELSM